MSRLIAGNIDYCCRLHRLRADAADARYSADAARCCRYVAAIAAGCCARRAFATPRATRAARYYAFSASLPPVIDLPPRRLPIT